MRGDFKKTYTPWGIKDKKEVSDFLLFLNKIEEIQMFLPEDGDQGIKLIKVGMFNIVTAFYKENVLKLFEKLAEKLEKMALDKENKIKLTGFKDFSKANEEVKKLNLLRIRIREAEALLYKIIDKLEEKYLVLARFLNAASKYLFYYTIEKYDLPEWVPEEKIKELREVLEK